MKMSKEENIEAFLIEHVDKLLKTTKVPIAQTKEIRDLSLVLFIKGFKFGIRFNMGANETILDNLKEKETIVTEEDE